ncbi:hypothetical protein FG379_002268 [Cryptosporidium bovis]|uniref:uncharacterized protein n=1 Tax=Cryptosporidium bovis TaxID=310047 RepID=UPI003519DC9D|nr:hypothetical protein FG379_002268 [Cryptosporidium bovis]
MNNLLQEYSSDEDNEVIPSLSDTDKDKVSSSSSSIIGELIEDEGKSEKLKQIPSKQNIGLITSKKGIKSKKKNSNSKKNKYLSEFYSISSNENIKVLNAKDILNESDNKDRGTVNVKKNISKNNWRPSINQKRKHQVS